jgi:hypothetical protein
LTQRQAVKTCFWVFICIFAVEEKRNIANKLIKRNLTNEDIAEDTGLTIEQVEQLRNRKD